MSWRDRLATFVKGPARDSLQGEKRISLGQYPGFLDDYYHSVGYQGYLYPLGLNQTALTWSKTEEISATLPNYMQQLRKSPPAFAAQYVRATVLSQARICWRNRMDRHTFRDSNLRLLEHPWPNGTTGELLGRMEWSAGLAGNTYVYRQPDRLRVLRPDWVAIVYGSNAEPEDPKGALDAEVLGYVYKNGGFAQNNKNPIQTILPEVMAHWTPLPDPMSPGMGMSWLTPILRDIQLDQTALEFKIAFFSNGATPNLVVKNVPGATPQQFQEWWQGFEAGHKGSFNAFKTIYLSGGADVVPVGVDPQKADLSSITSHAEERISYMSRVPAAILGIAAGLRGSSLNAGNYGETRRTFADTWYYSTLADCCAALQAITDLPGGDVELWFDTSDVPMLREDALAAAQIEVQKQQAIVAYVQAGFTPDSAVQAVNSQDVTELEYDERFISVQLQALTSAKTQPGPGPDEGALDDGSAAAAGNDNGTNGEIPARSNGHAPRSRATDLLAEPPAPVQNLTFQFPDHFITVPVTVQPANAPEVTITNQPAEVHVEQPITVAAAEPAQITNQFAAPEFRAEVPITVNPADVRIEQPITVEAAAAPQVTNQFAAPEFPVTVETPAVNVENRFDVQPGAAPEVRVVAPVNVNMPETEPSPGVDLVYDDDGRLAGTRSRLRPRKR